MTSRVRFLILAPMILVAAALGDVVAAQTAQGSRRSYIDPSGGLTVDDIVQLALEHSPRIAAVRERVAAAEGERQQAGLRTNPRADVMQREQIGGSDRQTAIDFTWPLELFRRSARTSAADRDVDVAKSQVNESEWMLAASVRREAIRALAAIRLLAVTRQQLDATRQLRDLVAGSVEIGATPRLDRDVADVERRRLEAAVLQREADVEASVIALRALAGLDVDVPLTFKKTLEEEMAGAVAATKQALNVGDAAGIAMRPDVKTLIAQAAAASAGRERERQQGRWDLDLTAGYMYTAMSFPQLGIGAGGTPEPIAGRFHEVSFGGMLALPWFNRNQGTVAAATAMERVLVRDRDALERESRAEIAAATERWNANQRAAAIYTDGLLELAARNIDVIQQTYQAGRGTLNDVIAERRRQLDLEMDYTNLLLDTCEAGNDLRRALGVIR